MVKRRRLFSEPLQTVLSGIIPGNSREARVPHEVHASSSHGADILLTSYGTIIV
jgi:hypothetical protein